MRKYLWTVCALLSLVLLPSGVAIGSERSSEDLGEQVGVAMSPELGDAMEMLEPRAREEWPTTFAGLWADETTEKGRGVIHSVKIAFIEGAKENVVELGRNFPYPDLLEPVTVQHSMEELERRQMEIVHDREAIKNDKLEFSGSESGMFNLDIDLDDNAIVVTVPNIDEKVVSAFKSRYGDDIQIQQGALGEPKDCNSRSDCLWNLRAGLRVDSWNWSCSTGFTVRNAIGVLNVMSAGHCLESNRYHASYQYGEVKQQQVSSRVDAERHFVDMGNDEVDFFNAIPSIYATNEYKKIAVRTRSSWEGLVVGTNACKSGWRTGKTCGEILGKSFTPWWVPSGNSFIKVLNCAEEGDSGGPLYDASNWSKAHGLLSGGPNTLCPDPTQWNAYGHIEYALNALGLTLMVSP